MRHKKENQGLVIKDQLIKEIKFLKKQTERFAKLQFQHKKMEESLRESEEHARIFASYQHVISELRQFYATEAGFKQMLQKTVDLLVENFSYYMAWYGELKPHKKLITPKVWSGRHAKYLDGLQLELDDSKDAKCALSLAILTKKPFGYADLEHDRDFKKWRPLALKYGYRSNQAIPLIVEGRCIGAFLIYSTHAFAFDKKLIMYLKGVVDELATIIENITRRRKLIDELKKAQSSLEEKVRQRTQELEVARGVSENIIENANALIMAGNTKGELTIFNKTYQDFTGYKKEAVLGKAFSFLMPEEEHKKHLSTFKDVFKGKHTRDYEITILTKEGQKKDTLFSSTLINDEKGNPMVVGIGYDITERKKTEAALKESERDLRKQKLSLEQKNFALKELLEEIERTKNKIKDDIGTNISELLLPILTKLKVRGELSKYINVLRHHLEELTSSFGRKITKKSTRLTPREIEICGMIKGGLTSKELSRLLNVSSQTVEKHRKNIRKKLSISNKKVNLASFLQGI
jgi:PAS domain S-box-containing protein